MSSRLYFSVAYSDPKNQIIFYIDKRFGPSKIGLTQSAIMQVAFGRVRRKIALLRTIRLLRNTRVSKVYLFVVR